MPCRTRLKIILAISCLFGALWSSLNGQCDIATPDLGCDNVTYQDTCTLCGDGSPVIVAFYIDFPDQDPFEDYGITIEYGNATDGFQVYTNDNYDSGSTIQFVIDTTTLIYLTEVTCPNGDTDNTGLGDTVIYFYEFEPVFDNPGLLNGCDSVQLPPISGTNVPPNAAYFTLPGGGGEEFAPGDWVSTSGFYYIFGQNGLCEGQTTFEVEIEDCPTCDIATPDLYCSPLTLADTCVYCDDDSPGLIAPIYIDFPGQGPGETYNLTLETVTEGNLMGLVPVPGYSSGAPVQFNTQDSFIVYLTSVECPNGEIDTTDLGDTVYIFVTREPTFNQLGPLVQVCDSTTLPPIEGLFVPPDAAYYSEPGGNGTQFQPGDWITESGTYYIYGTNGTCVGEIEFDVEILPGADPSWDPPAWICANQFANEFTLTPTGDPGGTWSGPGITDNGDGTALFEPDDTGPGVFSITYTVGTPPCQASSTQNITVSEVQTEILSVDCDDNGTPLDPSDDFYTATIVVNGVNTGSTWTAYDPWQTTGNFGDTATFGPLVPNGTNSFGINDDGPTNCQGNIVIDPGPPCSTDDCNIEIEPGDVLCNANNTWFDPTDDVITQGLVITNGGAGGTFTADDPNNTTGTFGTITIFGPYNSNGQDVTFTITSDSDPSCFIEWTVPHTCNADCEIQSVEIDSVRCNDAGTPDDASDDFITFVANVNGGIDLSDGYFVTSSAGSILPTFGFYDSLINFQTEPGTAGGDPVITITFIDFDNPECTFDVDIDNPGSCICDLSVIAGSVICFDNNTPNDPSDDIISQGLNIDNGGVPGSFTATDPNNTTGPYNGAVAFGPYTTDQDITFLIVDDNNPSCFIEWTIPYTCDDQCNIDSAEIGFIDCIDNGTPNDPDDDYVIFSMNPQGTNLGSSYTVNANFNPIQPDNANYGTFEVFTLPPGSAGNNVLFITIIDNDDPSCIFSFELDNPGSCSSGQPCNLSDAGLAGIVCNDFGSPSPDDDYVELTLNPTGTGLGSGYIVTSNDVMVSGGPGIYGSPVAFQLFNAFVAPDPITITITDQDDPDCSITVEVDNVTPCSDGCSIQTAFLSVNDCDDNGTPGDPSDDTFTFELNMTGTNTGSGWTADDPLSSSGEYDVQQTLGPYLISNGNIQITVTDNDDPNCTFTFSVIPPPPCSNPPPCNIENANITGVACDNNGTPFDPSDDFIAFDLNASGTLTGPGYSITSSAGVISPASGVYDQDNTFSTAPGTAGNGNITITITDNNDPSCTFSFTVQDPGSCADPCTIQAEFVEIQCLDSGTPSDPSDDIFTVDVLVTGSGSGWIADDPNGSSGSMGDISTVGGYLISDGTVTITFTDVNDPACTAQLTISTLPDACSDQCDIEASLTDLVCDDNGTPNTSADDVYFITVLVTGTNNGSSWLVTNPFNVGGDYATPVEIGPLSLTGTTVIEFTDIDNPACTTELIIDGTGGCSAGFPPSDTTFVTQQTCDPAQQGINTQILSSSIGCDSVVVTESILLTSDTTFINDFTCSAPDTGLTVEVLQNVFGCDSVVVEQVLLLPSDTTLLTSSSCDPADTATTISILTNAAGCDSVVIEEVLFRLSDTTLIDEKTCDPFDTVTTTELLTNAQGCDSLIITGKLFVGSDTTFVVQPTCNPADSNTIIEVLVNSEGCDSVVVISNNLILPDTTFLSDVTCVEQDTGTSAVVLQSAAGCDSVVVTSTTYSDTDTTFLSGETCIPADTGIFISNLTAVDGCDSTIVRSISLATSDTTVISSATCDPGDTATTVETLVNLAGCDSIVITTITLLPSDTTFFSGEVCSPADTGTTIETYTNVAGCDSLVLITNTLIIADTVYRNETICPGDSLMIGTEFYSMDNPGGIQEIPSALGCDSVLKVSLDFYQEPELRIIDTLLCPGEFVVINGEVYDANNPTGIQVVTNSISGCDSLIFDVNVRYDNISTELTLRSPECLGGKGSITIEALSGAEFPVVIDFNSDTSFIIDDVPFTYSNLASGINIVSIADASGCFASDTVEILEGILPEIQIDSIVIIPAGGEIQLQPIINFNYDNILWEPAGNLSCTACPDPIVTANSEVELRVTAFSNSGCMASKTVFVIIEGENPFYTPNVFSPNGDGVNDYFTVYAEDDSYEISELVIYDRWGNLVFRKSRFPVNQPSAAWDGRFSGELLNPGVYIYVARLTSGMDDVEQVVRGDVTLIR